MFIRTYIHSESSAIKKNKRKRAEYNIKYKMDKVTKNINK